MEMVANSTVALSYKFIHVYRYIFKEGKSNNGSMCACTHYKQVSAHSHISSPLQAASNQRGHKFPAY